MSNYLKDDQQRAEDTLEAIARGFEVHYNPSQKLPLPEIRTHLREYVPFLMDVFVACRPVAGDPLPPPGTEIPLDNGDALVLL